MAEAPTLTNLVNLQNETTAVTAINGNNAAITTAFEDVLSLSGTAPNQMQSNLDMNSNQILNLPNPATANSPLRLQDLETFIGGGTISNIPAGGTAGQVLGKTSNTDYAIGWENSVTSVGLALPSDLTVTNSPVTSSGTLTGAWTTTPTGTGAMVRATSPTLVTPVLGTPTSGVATNLTGTAAGLTAGTVTTNANLTGPIVSTGNATAVASQTGTGSTFVMNTSPVLITPALGTPVSGVATNLTGTAAGLTAGAVPANNLTGATLNSGVVTSSLTSFGNTPAFVTPSLGTPSSGILTNCTGTAAGLTAGHVTTNANLTGPITSVGNATAIAAQTGTGSTIVTQQAPTINIPNITGDVTGGNATAGSIGQYVETVIPVGSAISLTSGAVTVVASLTSLPAGDWDINASLSYVPAGTTTVSFIITSISTTSTTDLTNGRTASASYPGTTVVVTPLTSSVAPIRFNLSTATTINLIADAQFGVSTMTVYGIIRARRIR